MGPDGYITVSMLRVVFTTSNVTTSRSLGTSSSLSTSTAFVLISTFRSGGGGAAAAGGPAEGVVKKRGLH